MAHKDVLVPFVMDGREFEAVGFLDRDEISVSRDIMVERVAGKNGGIIGEGEERFIGAGQRRGQFPVRLERYSLIVDHPLDGGGMACFRMEEGVWKWLSHFGPYNSKCLAIRRVVK